jgi:gliding motility-associated-like protein
MICVPLPQKSPSLHKSIVVILFTFFTIKTLAQSGILASSGIGSNPQIPQSPFICSAEFYFTIGPGELSVLDPNNPSGGLQLLFSLPENVNATGYNPLDNYIYAIGKGTLNGHVLRIHSEGTVDDLGDIGLPLNPVTGGFAPDGLWYVKEGNTQEIAIIDLGTLTFTLTDPGSLFDGKDWAYHYEKDKFYGVHEDILYSYDPVANTVESFPVTGFLPENGVTCGAAFYSDDGFIYVLNNLSGYLYRIDVDTQEAFFVHAGPTGLSSVDGCACPYSPPPFPVVYAESDSFCLDINGTQSFFIHDNDEVNIAHLDFNTFSVILPPMYGTIDYNSSTGELTYTSNGAPQVDSLVYEICCDGPAVTCDQATIYITPAETTNFDTFGPYCAGETPDNLPASSNEGISGEWFPAFINTDFPGSYDYNFTPDPLLHPCALPSVITVEIEPTEVPGFTTPGPYCTGEIPGQLPEFSQEGIAGDWFPAVIDTDSPGDQVYTFTPDPTLHPCGTEVDLTITVFESTEPYFEIPADLCQFEIPPTLPSISDDGVEGSWFPPVVSTDDPGIYEYTFTPDPDTDPCAEIMILAVTVNAEESPSFSIPTRYCLGESPDILPDTSLEGISGTWNPAIIDTDLAGDTSYVFTPDPLFHPCGQTYQFTVSVLDQIEPSFSLPAKLCQFETAPELPDLSLEGVFGTWVPAVVPTDSLGTFSFTFTPDQVQFPCADPVTMMFDIGATTEPSFDAFGPYCQFDPTPVLPPHSNNGIIGSWLPNTLLTDTPGDYMFIFTPDPLLHPCVTPDTLYIEVSGQLQASFSFVREFCLSETPAVLPGTSIEGITGSWFPPVISTDLAGTSSYTFTPDPTLHPCGIPTQTEVVVHPKVDIAVIDQTCADDLGTYALEILVTGGTAPLLVETAAGYAVTNLGGAYYLVENIPSGSGVDITVTDDKGCAAVLVSDPHFCDCPDIDPPTGAINASYCYGESPSTALQVGDPGTGYEIHWFSEDSLFLSDGKAYLPEAAGTYFAVVVDPVNQCASEWIPLQLDENPALFIEGYSAICDGSTAPYELEITITGGSPGYEVDAGGLPVDNTDPNTFIINNVPDINGWTIGISDAMGCMADAYIQPEILPLPIAEAGPDQLLDCFDGWVMLDGYTRQPGQSDLDWTSENPVFSSSVLQPEVNESSIYYLTVTDQLTGCRAIDSTTVFDPEYPEFDFTVEPIRCHGDQNGEIHFTALEGGMEPYLFSIDAGENYYLGNTFASLAPGVYGLVVQDVQGCESTEQIILEEPDPIEIVLNTEGLIQFGDQVQIDVETNLDEDAIAIIQWDPAEGLDCVDCLEPMAIPLTDTEYTLMVTDTSGCTQEASVVIRVQENKEVFIPNVFSPNGDQINDYFYIQSSDNIERIEVLRVFHRWGHLVFEALDQLPDLPHNGWDGRFKGELLTPDVFTYYAKILLLSGSTLVVYGDVTLLR